MIVVGSVLLPLTLWGWLGVETRELVLQTAQADQRRVTEALSQHTLNLLQTQALVLDLVDRQIKDRDCQSLGSDAGIKDFLTVATQRPAQADAVRVTDVQGNICLLTNQTVVDTRNRGFRDYFIGARDVGPGHYYVDHAIVGMVSGTAVFNVAKPRMKNGVFNGVVAIAVNIADLTRTWQEVLSVSPSQRLSLFRADGVAIARSWMQRIPEVDASAAREFAANWQATPFGSRVGPSSTDGAQRVGAWRSLPDWGVVVTSSLDETEVLRPWRRSMLIYGLLAALTSILSAALARSIMRGHQLLAHTVAQRTDALRVSEERLRLFIDGAPTGVVLFDRNMRYLAVSRRYLRDHGAPYARPEELVGRSIYAMFPDTPRHWHDIHRRVLAGEAISTEDDLVVRPDGRSDWMSWAMAPWYERDGTIGGAVLFVENVTVRKQAELLLERGKDELEQLVTERTQELTETQARLAQAQRMEALGQLAGGIAHDFNNVLQAIQGAASLMESRPADPGRVRSLSRMISETVERGAAITRRLLAFSRQGDLQSEPIAVGSLLADMQQLLTHTIGAGITVTLHVEDRLSCLLADRRQLETVLVNLATNARDALSGSGTLSLAAALDRLDQHNEPGYPATLQPGSYVRLSVRDSGAGMTAAVLARASEPFFTTKQVGRGTGLGLAMARGFAEQSGGGFDIKSAPGHGTTVSMWFPVADSPIAASVALSATTVLSLDLSKTDRFRLLLVDDNTMVRETLAQQMEAKGFATRTAMDGAEALALLDAGEVIDLIITDYSMPGMDGVTLIREAQRRRPLLPAILLTGFTANAAEMAITGAVNGTFTLLRKPVSDVTLAERARALLHV